MVGKSGSLYGGKYNWISTNTTAKGIKDLNASSKTITLIVKIK